MRPLNNSRRKFLQTTGAHVAAISFPLLDVPHASARDETSAQQAPGNIRSPICASVRDLGLQFLNNSLRITGQDGATSTPLSNGDGLWFFGDTIEGPFESIRNHCLTEVLSNTASIIPSQDISQGFKKFVYLTSADGKRPRQVIEFDANENRARHRLWPIHSVCVADTIYVYYHKITMDPDVNVFENFQLNGMGIARARVGEYRFERLLAPDGSKEFWKGNQPSFGVFIEKLADGYLYLWGCFWSGMFLARTDPDSVGDLASYEYLVQGPTLISPGKTPVWSKKFEPTAVLFDGVPNELSVSYNPHLGKYLATHVSHRENRLVFRTAPAIVGPWSESETFFRPTKIRTDDLFTAGKEHPELRREHGKILYVTYVNSSVYAPHLLEITLR